MAGMVNISSVVYSILIGKGNGSRPVAFLQHGLLDSAAAYTINNYQESLAYILADNGYLLNSSKDINTFLDSTFSLETHVETRTALKTNYILQILQVMKCYFEANTSLALWSLVDYDKYAYSHTFTHAPA